MSSSYRKFCAIFASPNRYLTENGRCVPPGKCTRNIAECAGNSSIYLSSVLWRWIIVIVIVIIIVIFYCYCYCVIVIIIIIVIIQSVPRDGSRIFFRRGCPRLLLYFNTNKPHSFFFCRIAVVLENRRSSQEGGGVRTPCTLPLDPPLLMLFLPLTLTVFVRIQNTFTKIKVV